MYSNPVIQSDAAELLGHLPEAALEFLRGATVLVTGATGLIGLSLAHTLMYANDHRALGARIGLLVRDARKAARLFPEAQQRTDVAVVVGDMRGEISFSEVYDVILHAAAETQPGAFVSAPVDTIESSVLGTRALLARLRDQAQGRLLLFSTREVYGHSERRFAREDEIGSVDPIDPRACYPEAKRLAESLCVAYERQYGVVSRIVRIAHTYGPGMSLLDGRVLSDVFGRARAREGIELHSDGSGELAVTYVSDVLLGALIALVSEQEAVLNISNDRDIVTVGHLADVVAEEAALLHGRPIEVTTLIQRDTRGYLRAQPPFLLSERARSLGWSDHVSLRDGVRRTLRW